MEVVNNMGNAKQASDVEINKQPQEESAQIQTFTVIRIKREEKIASKKKGKECKRWTE